MYNISNLLITHLEELSGSEEILIVSSAPYNKYVDGQRTNEHGGFSYTVVFPMRKYASVVIKTEEKVASITQEQIDASPIGGIKARTVNFRARVYKSKDSNEYLLSCKADKFVPTNQEGGGKR